MPDSNVTLKQIEAFYWAANLGSFSIAAERLHVTQSSLSKRIQELEDGMGVQLFERSGRRAQLTDRGQRVVPVARQMLELKGALKAAVTDSPRLAGTCRFGVSELASLTWLPDFIRVVRADHPELVLQPYVDLGRNLERRVVKGELDFAVAAGPAEHASVQARLVARVEYGWIASPARCAAGSVLSLADLERHPVITMPEGSGSTRAFDAWAAEHGLRVQRTLACNSLMAIVGLTLADMGISFLPAPFTRPWIQRGTLVALHGNPPLPSLPYYFVQRTDDQRDLLKAMHGYVMRVAQFNALDDDLAIAAEPVRVRAARA
jgi:DNA-binding transcriptional LysR family regulator